MARLEVMDGRDLLLDLADRGGDALVVLGTPACGACRRARQVLAGMDDAQLGGPGLTIASVDATHAMGLVHEWEVRHFPALVLVRAGDPWARVSATLAVAALSTAIRAAREGPPDDAL
jgi:thioredoxin-like negative regulator of GroEL